MEEFRRCFRHAALDLQLVIELAGVAMFATLLVAGVVTIGDNLNNQTATLEMPFWLFMGPLASARCCWWWKPPRCSFTRCGAGGRKTSRRC